MMREIMRYEGDDGTTTWAYLVSKFSVSPHKYNDGDFYLTSPCPIPSISYRLAMELSNESPPAPNPAKIKDTPIPTRAIQLPKGKHKLTSEGMNADKRILKLFSAGLFLTPEEPFYMAYAPHQLFYTNTKTAKSWFGSQVGVRVDADAASTKALIGFGTAERTRLGSLSGMFGSMLTIDEVPEKLGEDLFGGLLTAMELGKITVIKGLSEQAYPCCSPIVFAGNPRGDDSSNGQSLYAMMDLMLRKVSLNTEAFGSRFAAITFGLKYRAVSGSTKSKARDETLRAISLSKQKMENGLVLLKELNRTRTIEWLGQPFPPGYHQSIEAFKDKCPERLLNDFLRGHLQSYRHARGLALRLSILSGETPATEMDWVMHHNLESFETIMEFSSEYAPQVKRAYQSACSPQYLAYFFTRLGAAMSLLGVKALKWGDVDYPNTSQFFGISREVFKRKVILAIQKDFADDIQIDGDTIAVQNAGVLNLVHDDKFKNALWNAPSVKEKDAGG
jgi:hypothetical protein